LTRSTDHAPPQGFTRSTNESIVRISPAAIDQPGILRDEIPAAAGRLVNCFRIARLAQHFRVHRPSPTTTESHPPRVIVSAKLILGILAVEIAFRQLLAKFDLAKRIGFDHRRVIQFVIR
jgi:hypothetical protein